MKKKSNTTSKIHIHLGEKVKVISGKYKGKTGYVKRVMKSYNKIIVEGINLRFKHIKSKNREESGSIKRMEFPIHSSNVMLIKG